MTRTSLNTASRSTILLVTAFIAGCSSMGEEVYTRQNQAASALATMEMEAEAKNPGKADRIYKAESDLHDACAPLREVASRRMTGEPVGLDSQFVVLVSLDRCANETERAEEFIRLDNPSLAQFYLGSGGTHEIGSSTGPANMASGPRSTMLQFGTK